MKKLKAALPSSHVHRETPLVESFKNPGSIILLGSAFTGVSIYAFTVIGMIGYDIFSKLFGWNESALMTLKADEFRYPLLDF